MTADAVFPLGRPRVIYLRGTQVDVLSTVDDCKGASTFEFHALPGFDTGSHVHSRIEELFYVLEGEMELRVGDRVTVAGPGTFACVPVGVAHAFANRGGDTTRMLLVTTPPGHEHYFEELAAILGVAGPPDTQAIASLRARYDTTQVSPLVT